LLNNPDGGRAMAHGSETGRTAWGRGATLGLLLLPILAGPSGAAAPALTAEAVNAAQFDPAAKAPEGIDPVVLKAQILLDRQRFSPGSIDGRPGENFAHALDAFASARGMPASGRLTPETWNALAATYDGPVLVPYGTTDGDVKGPFVEKIPSDYEEMAELDALGYTSAKEGLAEKFHLSPALLDALNPKADLDKAGTEIIVPAVRANPEPAAITNRNAVPEQGGKAVVIRIEVDKAARSLSAFDAEGKLVGFYPASIGSDEKPAPSGRFAIRAIARDPTYTYDPDYAFKGVRTKKKVTVPAGPNNPVGAVWLDLTAESYGIHGAPEPERIGKSYSHGCVRLTNWDVKDLASLAGKGTAVEFKE
jgi:lipoprotein-anchoring transpeptidase ErfK/SrfK